jgi:16S rRNA (adenine1518-N6/adenine1519-N6)-dimethyltransferase
MEARKERLADKETERIFFRVVRAAFGQRRKTLVNALNASFEKTHTKEEITRIVEKCGFDVRVRGEVLSIDDFKRLSSSF